jgi:hypothetical protein
MNASDIKLFLPAAFPDAKRSLSSLKSDARLG